jgi:cytidylate kinase
LLPSEKKTIDAVSGFRTLVKRGKEVKPKRIIIAIDGPAASGKSTTARLLARRLDYTYLDTGAMYRACALKAFRLGICLDDSEAIAGMLEGIRIELLPTSAGNAVMLDGEDVSEAIRDHQISRLASDVSALPEVRHKMVDLQRRMASGGGVILDGRDIGTYVFPQAELKFFLIADPRVRAERRWKELKAKGMETDLESVLTDLLQRDKNDQSRALAPLKPAPDAIVVDTGGLSIEGQVEVLYQYARKRLSES